MEDSQLIAPEFQKLIDKSPGTFSDVLGIKYLEASPEKIKAQLDIEAKHLQAFGFVHGGVSLAFAETVVSMGAFLHIDPETEIVFGQEINANHLKSIQEGSLIAEASPLHIGSRSQVWEVKIKESSRSALVAISRCTLAVVKKRK